MNQTAHISLQIFYFSNSVETPRRKCAVTFCAARYEYLWYLLFHHQETSNKLHPALSSDDRSRLIAAAVNVVLKLPERTRKPFFEEKYVFFDILIIQLNQLFSINEARLPSHSNDHGCQKFVYISDYPQRYPQADTDSPREKRQHFTTRFVKDV
ncbi:MAG: hypothetical protein AAF755_05375 [Pseudomonadota bacterium]